ncbi:MAG: hypothetical protein M3P16_07325 [Chloroflexota bacterium]|nr:hypothetical protein [Chloroflexota bacterium]
MADKEATPRASDDLATAERKSKTVDERIPEREATDSVPEIALPGSAGAYVPQGGIGREGPPGTDISGPGEAALEKERKAQVTSTSHG